jgi:3-oxoacid CoA-transferase
VVASTGGVDLAALIEANRMRKRPPDAPRTYHGKPGLSRSQVAARAAALLPEGSYVNLGAGIPTLVSDHIAGRDITLHTENGILGYGPVVDAAAIDLDHYTAGSRFVSLRPDASFFDSVTSFEMVRGGALDAVVLGAYQVDAAGNLANWTTPEQVGGGIGGAMDLAAGDNRVIVCMEHTERDGGPKLLETCTYPVTGLGCVDAIVTDLGLFIRSDGRFTLTEIAPGFSVEEVLGLTAMAVEVADPLGSMTDALAARG